MLVLNDKGYPTLWSLVSDLFTGGVNEEQQGTPSPELKMALGGALVAAVTGVGISALANRGAEIRRLEGALPQRNGNGNR